MEFKSVTEEPTQKSERQRRSFNTGTTVDASVGVIWDGNSSYTHMTFESGSDQEVRVRVLESGADHNSSMDLSIDGEWEAKALAQAMEWAAQRILRPKQQLTHEQARAFLDALCGTETLEGGDRRPKSRAAHTHLAAVLGLGQLPTDANLVSGWNVDPGGRVRGVAGYLIAAGHALLSAIEHEEEKLQNPSL
ncbi:MAG: hypothetical protein EOP84_14705 [Verrucomicrobiaceae bacterium]|nr:MAG: hypothetical protein EOP84_14705 [Verrucomicrobiaceae bacterium]